MRKPMLLVVVGALFAAPGAVAQVPLPPPAQALDIRASEFQTLINAYPGGNAEIKSVDAGKHVIDLWLEQRKAGLSEPPGRNGIAHSEITEIYYILQGLGDLGHRR